MAMIAFISEYREPSSRPAVVLTGARRYADVVVCPSVVCPNMVPLLTIALTAAVCVSVVWFTKRHVKDSPVGLGGRMPKTSTAEHFFERAEQCFRRSHGDRKIAVELDAMGNEFMARAIELDTEQQKLARAA
jgi:hypothetical protein